MSCVSSIAKIERLGKLTDHFIPFFLSHKNPLFLSYDQAGEVQEGDDACTKKQSHAL